MKPVLVLTRETCAGDWVCAPKGALRLQIIMVDPGVRVTSCNACELRERPAVSAGSSLTLRMMTRRADMCSRSLHQAAANSPRESLP